MSIIDTFLNLPFPVLNHWGYWIILLAAMFEASPLLGLLIPGQVIVIIGGVLVKMGVLDIGDTIFIAAIGAILGDLIGYALGKKYGYSFITKYGKYFFFKKEYFEKTKKLVLHHTGKTLIIGRFNSIARVFAPFVAGASDISFIKFLTYNIIGGVSWAAVFVTLGYVFGGSYEIASKYMGRFIIIAIILSIVLIYLYRFINKRKHIFTKYHLYTLILNICSLYIFSKMIEDVIDGELVTKLDTWIHSNIIFLWNPVLEKIMILITNIASVWSLLVLSAILLLLLLYKKKWYYSLLFFLGMTGGLFFEFLIKLIIHRARPEDALVVVSGYSFPSGHATMSLLFFSVLLYAFKDEIKNRILRNIFIISNIIVFLLIGFSRIYLNVHWFSDVIAGFSLGLFWLTLLILIFQVTISLSKKTSKKMTHGIQYIQQFSLQKREKKQ